MTRWELFWNLCDREIVHQGAQHMTMLIKLRCDEVINGVVYMGLERAPAAVRNHHSHEGGLLDHMLEMWDCWESSLSRLFSRGIRKDHLSQGRILRAILYHDLHKGYRYYVNVKEGELPKECLGRPLRKSDWGTLRHPTSLMTDNAQTMQILMKHEISLDALQMNALQYSEGGWAETKPPDRSVLATVAYLLDELSGNGLARDRDGFWERTGRESR